MANSEKAKKRLFAQTVMKNALFWMARESNQKLGKLGEMYVTYWLKYLGYEAIDTSNARYQGDVTITATQGAKTIHFEVKTARRGNSGSWQFCLRKDRKTSINHSDYVVLLAVDDYGKLFRYVVPVDYFGKAQKFTISSHPTSYSGKVSPFLVRGDEIDLSDILKTYELIGA